jgi:SNF2 family DNA or RNA helicase
VTNIDSKAEFEMKSKLFRFEREDTEEDDTGGHGNDGAAATQLQPILTNGSVALTNRFQEAGINSSSFISAATSKPMTTCLSSMLPVFSPTQGVVVGSSNSKGKKRIRDIIENCDSSDSESEAIPIGSSRSDATVSFEPSNALKLMQPESTQADAYGAVGSKRSPQLSPVVHLKASRSQSAPASADGKHTGNKHFEDNNIRPHFENKSSRQPFEPLKLRAIRYTTRKQPLSHGQQQLQTTQTDEKVISGQVHKYARQYLFDHQVEGVRWLWEHYANRVGCILGDDMGMGKTIQVACFLMALLGKEGTSEDARWCRERRKLGNDALLDDGAAVGAADNGDVTPGSQRLPTCLIACPASVQENWYNELSKWGHFSISTILKSDYTAKDEDNPIAMAKEGRVEIVITSYDRLASNMESLSKIPWTVVVMDEAHLLKNSKTQLYASVIKLKLAKWRLGLTGTPIQNNLDELWALLNLVTHGKFLDRNQFRDEFELPIKVSIYLVSLFY